MPLYEYRCEGCGEVFEVMQKFADEPVKVHEKCGAPVQRLISSPSFHLKGSGWYATDYGKGSNGPAKSESEKKSSNTESSAKSEKSEKSDAKPAESKPAASDKSKSD